MHRSLDKPHRDVLHAYGRQFGTQHPKNFSVYNEMHDSWRVMDTLDESCNSYESRRLIQVISHWTFLGASHLIPCHHVIVCLVLCRVVFGKITRAKAMRNVSLVLNYYSTGTVEAAHFFFERFTHSWRLLGRSRLSGPVNREWTRERQTGRSSKRARQLSNR